MTDTIDRPSAASDAVESIGVDEAQEIADRMRRLAGSIARQQAQFLQLLDRIDQSEAWVHWFGIRTLAQWVSFVCEMDPHTAREHIRVMRGLRTMPQVSALLGEGRISFSKAREITRLSGRIDDTEAAEITTRATASQISSMVAAYRRLDAADPEDLLEPLVGRVPEGIAEVEVPRTNELTEAAAAEARDSGGVVQVRLPRHLEQDSLHVSSQQYGRARIILDLPEAEALELVAAVDAVREQLERAQEKEPAEHREASRPNRVDALVEVIRSHVSGSNTHTPSDAHPRVSAARATVLIHASPESLAQGSGGDVPAGTRATDSSGRTGRCHAAESGSVTAATAARLACGGELIGALMDASGDVLALGRSRRLASRFQRAALSARDMHCQFPDCTRRYGLEAHHIRMWSEGGPTDLDNMLLLCRSHHIAVHENRLRITRSADRAFTGALRGGTGFDFHTEEGVLICAPSEAASDEGDSHPVILDIFDARVGPQNPDIATDGGGWGFTLDKGLTWLFDAEAVLRERRDKPESLLP